jgi:capsular exopolysaccharide synthesis family protein
VSVAYRSLSDVGTPDADGWSRTGIAVGLAQVLRALQATWWLSAIGMIGGGLAGLGVSLLLTPVYTSSTQLFVSTTDSASTSEVFAGSQFSQQRVTSYAQLISGKELAGRVIDRLGLEMSPTELSREIRASAVTYSVLIDVTVTDPSPVRAQEIADAVGEEFTTLAQELEAPDSGGASPVKVTVTDRPEVARSPSSPDPVRNVILGLVLGAILGGAGAVARSYLDRSVKDGDEAADLAGAPVIGVVARDDTLARRHLVNQGVPNRTAEDYRRLRANLQFLDVDNPPRVIMVSSAVPSEGKTTLVVNLGLALVEAGRTVVIVEADLRRPKVTRYLGIVGGVGLTNILVGSAEVDEVLQRYGDGGLSVIAAGPAAPNPGQLLASQHMATLVKELRGRHDFVLVDAPPVLPVADASALASHVDGALLSIRFGSTRRDQVKQAAETLNRVGVRLLGAVLNIVPPSAEMATAHGYGYEYGYNEKRVW